MARRSVDFPPMFGPVSSNVRWWCPSSFSPRTMSLGTGKHPFSPRANVCHRPFILSTGPPLSLLVELSDVGTMTGLHIVPDEKLEVTAKDLRTSMQLTAWTTSNHWAAFSKNSSASIVSVSASESVTLWFWHQYMLGHIYKWNILFSGNKTCIHCHKGRYDE